VFPSVRLFFRVFPGGYRPRPYDDLILFVFRYFFEGRHFIGDPDIFLI